MENIAPALLEWFYKNQRILPFRTDPSPYHVWLSEIMLQQTRVSAALPYYCLLYTSQDTARSQRSSRKDEFQTNIHKRFPSFVVKILRPGRPENCRPETPR